MDFDNLIDRPNLHTLGSVLAGRKLDFIAPYARRGALNRIVPTDHDRVRIIVRLPREANGPEVRIDNDPRDLIDLLHRMGTAAKIYALPGAHTKLYINEHQTFYGSANFTLTGFGGNHESLLSTSSPTTRLRLRQMFDNYLSESTLINKAYLNKLKSRLENGEVYYTASPEIPQTLLANKLGDSVADFRSWLALQADNDSQYIEERFDPAAGYNMSGHVQSAFPGIRTFLRDNLDMIPILAKQLYTPHVFWGNNDEVVDRFKNFVRTKGHLFPANGGGAWRNKLPPFLGGPGPSGGGKGSGLIARMLVYLSRYAIEKGF